MDHKLRREMLLKMNIHHDCMNMTKRQWNKHPFIYFPCRRCQRITPVWKPRYRMEAEKVTAKCSVCKKTTKCPRELVDFVNYLVWNPGFRE